MNIITFEFNPSCNKVDIISDTFQKSKNKTTQRLIALIFNKIYYKNFHIKGNNKDDMKKNQNHF